MRKYKLLLKWPIEGIFLLLAVFLFSKLGLCQSISAAPASNMVTSGQIASSSSPGTAEAEDSTNPNAQAGSSRNTITDPAEINDLKTGGVKLTFHPPLPMLNIK